jgi:peptidoglycan/LPS O-acetylase OafA/YrhL
MRALFQPDPRPARAPRSHPRLVVTHRRYYALDGMRGFAAILVVLHHFGLQLDGSIAGSGYLAVDFFFALSGFVIGLAYQDRLDAGLSFRSFMTLRVLRLYPLVLVGIGFGVVKAIGQIALGDTTAMGIPTFLLSLVTALAMLPTPAAGLVSIFPLDTPCWSLFFELCVNVLFALVLYRWGSRRLLLALLIAYAALVPGIMTHGGTVRALGTNWSDFVWGIPRVAFAFLLGLLLHRLSIGRARATSSLAYVATIFLIALLLPHPNDGWARYYDLLVLTVAVPAILWAGIIWEVPVAHRRLFAWLGDISYPLYILHFPLLMMYIYVAKILHLPPFFVGVSFLAGVLLLSTLVLRLYDEPVRRRMTLWLRSPSNAVARAL